MLLFLREFNLGPVIEGIVDRSLAMTISDSRETDAAESTAPNWNVWRSIPSVKVWKGVTHQYPFPRGCR